MSSKLAQFLEAQGIDPRRLIATSESIERLRPEDRRQRTARRKAKAADPKAIPPKGEEIRSGRPVTERMLREATAGKAISGPAKTRLLRAINRILEQKQKDPIDLRALF